MTGQKEKRQHRFVDLVRVKRHPRTVPVLFDLRRGLRRMRTLRVLERPEIPLHTNASESDIRACVTKRKISGGTMSAAGRDARDVMLGLMKTCGKLGVWFFTYLGDRWGRNASVSALPPLANLVAAPT